MYEVADTYRVLGDAQPARAAARVPETRLDSVFTWTPGR
jgi:hypothetical protein